MQIGNRNDLVTRFAALAEIYSHHTLTRAIGQLEFAANGSDEPDKAFLQAAITLLIERNK